MQAAHRCIVWRLFITVQLDIWAINTCTTNQYYVKSCPMPKHKITTNNTESACEHTHMWTMQTWINRNWLQLKPGIEHVQALADISRSALFCCSNETRALIVNPPNSAQLKGSPYHSPNLHPGPCSSVGVRQETDRPDTQTHRETHRRPWSIYISPRLRLTRNVTRNRIALPPSHCKTGRTATKSSYWALPCLHPFTVQREFSRHDCTYDMLFSAKFHLDWFIKSPLLSKKPT